MTAVPFTAFCPECKAHRTFTVLGFERLIEGAAPIHDRPRVGCCVCGTSEREALIALSARLTDDKDSMGELAARLNTLDGELAELRDELHAFASPTRLEAYRHSRKVWLEAVRHSRKV